MLDWLADLITESWGQLAPVLIVAEYERAIVLRFGKYNRTLKAGVHWKIPFIDDVHSTDITVNTLNLPTQSLITQDGSPISVESVITYRVRNVRNYLLKMGDQEESLADIGLGVVKQAIRDHNWKDAADMDDVLARKLQKEAARFGFEILGFKLVQVSPRAKVIRLMQT
jgi:regulator of protease activity HflC (stomatin/prohibitin superfamily)